VGGPMTTPTVDSFAELGFALACDEVTEMMGGPEHIVMEDLTACEMIALLAVVRPAWERRAAARRQPAPVLTLVAATEGGCLTNPLIRVPAGYVSAPTCSTSPAWDGSMPASRPRPRRRRVRNPLNRARVYPRGSDLKSDPRSARPPGSPGAGRTPIQWVQTSVNLRSAEPRR
jgi:hypothetical protein